MAVAVLVLVLVAHSAIKDSCARLIRHLNMTSSVLVFSFFFCVHETVCLVFVVSGDVSLALKHGVLSTPREKVSFKIMHD